MNCSRAEELFSDDLERTLEAPLLDELHAHLAECPRCQELRRFLPDVVTALHELGHSEAELPAGLPERVAAASFVRKGALPRLAWGFGRPSAFQAAAVFLGAIALWSLLSGFSPASTRRFTTRLVERSANTSAYLLERKERLVEDVRFLNVVLGTAFEERVDKMSARVMDYRRMLKKRPAAAPQAPKSGSNLPNPEGPGCVQEVSVHVPRGARAGESQGARA